eukprot:6199723-Pleurochrysis_carterae.AAC.2
MNACALPASTAYILSIATHPRSLHGWFTAHSRAALSVQEGHASASHAGTALTVRLWLFAALTLSLAYTGQRALAVALLILPDTNKSKHYGLVAAHAGMDSGHVKFV